MSWSIVVPTVSLRGHRWVGLPPVERGRFELVTLPGVADRSAISAWLSTRWSVVVADADLSRLHSGLEVGGGILEVWHAPLSRGDGLDLADGRVVGEATGGLSWLMAPEVEGLVRFSRSGPAGSFAAWALAGPLLSRVAPAPAGGNLIA